MSTFITEEILSEGGITGTSVSATTISGGTFYGNGSNLTDLPSTFTGGTVTGNTNFTGGLSANTFNIITIPTNNNTNTQILSRNSSTGDVEYTDSSVLSMTNGKVIGLTQIMYTI